MDKDWLDSNDGLRMLQIVREWGASNGQLFRQLIHAVWGEGTAISGWATWRTVEEYIRTVPTEPWADAFRDIFGLPWEPYAVVGKPPGVFHMPTVLPCGVQKIRWEWLQWNDFTVPRIAQKCIEDARCSKPCCKVDATRTYFLPSEYGGDELNNQDLLVLADALEESGCNLNSLLEHLRTPQKHYTGCFAVRVLAEEYE